MLVGAGEQLFAVHKDVICAKSGHFKAACSGWKKGGGEITVHLPGVQGYVFQHYVDWVYGNTLVATSTVDGNVEMAIKLHLLGGVLDDVKLRNRTVKALNSISAIDKIPNAAVTKAIWAITPTNSLLRKWAVGDMIMRGDRDRFEQAIADYPTEFVQEVAVKLLKQQPTTTSKASQADLREYLEAEDDA